MKCLKQMIRHNSLQSKAVVLYQESNQTGEEDISSSGSTQGSNNNTSPLKGNSSAFSALGRNTQLS